MVPVDSVGAGRFRGSPDCAGRLSIAHTACDLYIQDHASHRKFGGHQININ